jgi:thiol-disulfide isomerase/thioredoxin
LQLSDFKGKVVFIDFWFEGCSNCVSYHQNIVSKVEQIYRNNSEVVFITIATMGNRESWKTAVKSRKYTSSHSINLISPQGNAYPLNQQFNINSAPHPIVVDRSGHLFNNSASDLRGHGVEGLNKVIAAALASKPI